MLHFTSSSPKLKRRSDRRTARNVDRDQPWIPWRFEMSVFFVLSTVFQPLLWRSEFHAEWSKNDESDLPCGTPNLPGVKVPLR